MGWLLAGDIGGTKTILSLMEGPEVKPLHTKRYPSGDFDDLTPMVREFLAEVEGHHPERACFAVAGPVINQTSRITNLPWQLQSKRLQSELDIPQVQLINDFSAIGYGVLGLDPSDLHTLQIGEPHPGEPVAVLGAGTGLGQTYLTSQAGRYQVHGSEGGHTDFAPRSELEFELLRYLWKRHPRVSVERVVSGQGIVAIYQFLRDRGHAAGSPDLTEQIRAWEAGSNPSLDAAAQITNAALDRSDPLAEETLRLFVSAYGAEAGNLALKLLPYGGLYLAGGIAAKLLRLLETGDFLHAFLDKGRMRPLLETISIQVVLNTQVGLLGAGLYAASW